ncbi:MAG: type II secretion system protein N [Gallionellaceae bacterium]|jgi:general secretion pathway protein N
MKKIGWKLYVLFACAFLLVLMITAPATVLSGIVESASKGQFVLANATGTIWRGSAAPAIRQHSGSFQVLQRLNWDISIMPIFTGKLIIRLRWDNTTQAEPMVVTVTYKQIELRNALLPLNASLLAELSPMLKPVQLSGQMQINSPLFTFSRMGMSGKAVAEWTNAGSILSSIKPLGQYRIDLAGAGSRLDFTLSTSSGVLLLDGKGSFAPEQGLRFNGTARAANEGKSGLDELLNNFGPESAPGVHTLNLMH